MTYPLARDTADLLAARTGQNHNLGLALDRYLPLTFDGNDWNIPVDVKKRQRAPHSFHGEPEKLINRCRRRHEAIHKSFQEKGYWVEVFTASSDFRLVVGFGAEHVLETSLCLHRIFGFPIIPGSAVKGIARAKAFWELAESFALPVASVEESKKRKQAKPPQPTPLQLFDDLLSEGDEKKQQGLLKCLQADALCPQDSDSTIQSLTLDSWFEQAGDFHAVFGTTEHQGQVIFLDAYPKAAPTLKLDILNPHYGSYYSSKGKNLPSDDDKPVPTYFLTVGEGSQFGFSVASKNPALTQKAKKWLVGGLIELGVGGKTSSGYGFMNQP